MPCSPISWRHRLKANLFLICRISSRKNLRVLKPKNATNVGIKIICKPFWYYCLLNNDDFRGFYVWLVSECYVVEFFFHRFGHVNYEDPHFNVGLPVFTIHGNHDDPAGVVCVMCIFDIVVCYICSVWLVLFFVFLNGCRVYLCH